MKSFGYLAGVCSAFLLAGCDPAALQGGPEVAVIDLAAVAKATGQEEEIRVKAEEARNELTAQLQQLAVNLEEQLQAERDKMGASPSEDDAQRLQAMSIQAQQQVNSAQAQAQNQAALVEQQLVNEYRAKVEPLAREIANELGASIVVTADANVVWFDPAVDITDEVIAAWRALPAEEPPVEPAVETEPAEQTPAEDAPVAGSDEPVAETGSTEEAEVPEGASETPAE